MTASADTGIMVPGCVSVTPADGRRIIVGCVSIAPADAGTLPTGCVILAPTDGCLFTQAVIVRIMIVSGDIFCPPKYGF